MANVHADAACPGVAPSVQVPLMIGLFRGGLDAGWRGSLEWTRHLLLRTAELRCAFSEIEFLCKGGIITQPEEIALLRSIIREIEKITAEMRRIIRWP